VYKRANTYIIMTASFHAHRQCSLENLLLFSQIFNYVVDVLWQLSVLGMEWPKKSANPIGSAHYFFYCHSKWLMGLASSSNPMLQPINIFNNAHGQQETKLHASQHLASTVDPCLTKLIKLGWGSHYHGLPMVGTTARGSRPTARGSRLGLWRLVLWSVSFWL